MKTYLELTEVVPEEEEPEFIRCEITDKTDTEITAIKQAMIDVMEGKKYTLTRHLCRHDEGGACELTTEI
uniref:Uncharacterized protein n=1 Tax=viral metagenome TaxID=1070528 RepID=A0A6M3LAC4_9ZZZZ